MLRIGSALQHFLIIVGLNDKIVGLLDKRLDLIRDMTDIGDQAEADISLCHHEAHIVGAVMGHMEWHHFKIAYHDGLVFLDVSDVCRFHFMTHAIIVANALMYHPGGIDGHTKLMAEASHRFHMVGMVVCEQDRVDAGIHNPIFVEEFLQRADSDACIYHQSIVFGEKTIAIPAAPASERDKSHHNMQK